MKKAGSEGVVNVEGLAPVKKVADSETEMVSVKEVTWIRVTLNWSVGR